MSLSFSASVPVFDANVGIGHRHNRRYPYDSADGLLEEMARHGVDRALVYHVQGELISPSQGNEQLADSLRRNIFVDSEPAEIQITAMSNFISNQVRLSSSWSFGDIENAKIKFITPASNDTKI